jgi:predicted dithiol-disulfide oxidoreductase (DUF899 family)
MARNFLFMRNLRPRQVRQLAAQLNSAVPPLSSANSAFPEQICDVRLLEHARSRTLTLRILRRLPSPPKRAGAVSCSLRLRAGKKFRKSVLFRRFRSSILSEAKETRKSQKPMSHPQIVSREEWQRARDQLLVKEKAATRARDALAAERRRLPMVRIEKNYFFEGPDGKVSLLDLFEGRRQLIIYHFMFAPDVDGWPSAGCPGCSMVVDNIGHLAHLHARDTSFALVSRAPLANLESYKRRMGWTVPWFSSAGTDFNDDFGVTTAEGENFGLSVFLRDGDTVFHSYFTTARGVDVLDTNFTLLDMTPFGRQEDWEDSPAGWPQTPPFEWWRRHDEY